MPDNKRDRKAFFENRIELKKPIGLIDAKELANLLSLSPWTIRKWRAEGKIPFVRLGRAIRYRLDEVIDSLNEGETYGKKKES